MKLSLSTLALIGWLATDANAIAPQTSPVPGLDSAVAQETLSVDDTVALIERTAAISPTAAIVARVDHAAAARRIGLELRPTQLLLIDDLAYRAPLIASSQTAAIDLPQAVLVWQDGQGATHVGYNNVAYLAARHGVAGIDDTATLISEALVRLTRRATGVTLIPGGADVAPDEGLVRVESAYAQPETVSRLEQAVNASSALNVMARVDFAPAANTLGKPLRPTTLLLIGSPAVGTPLMQANQTVGIDLPQRVLVYEDADGRTRVAYNDPAYLVRRHSLTGVDESVARATEGLARLAATAAGAVASD